jgi:hypothetical protein
MFKTSTRVKHPIETLAEAYAAADQLVFAVAIACDEPATRR